MRQPGDRAPAPPELAPAQDLLNTVDIEMGREALDEPEALTRFGAAHGIALRATARDLTRVRRFREALRDVCGAHAGFDASPESLSIVNEEFNAARLAVVVGSDGSADVGVDPRMRGADLLVGHIAAGIAQATVRGSWERLKACAAHECRWVYYDRSPSGRSRWCTMSICGSRAKVRAYRERQRRQ